MIRYRPHTIVVEVQGMADDGSQLRPINLQAVGVPWADFPAWARDALPRLVAQAEAEINAQVEAQAAPIEVEAPANGNGNRAQRRAGARSG